MENFVGTSLDGPEHKHFYNLIEMFPDVCPNYVRKLCLGKDETDQALDELTLELLNGKYKKRKRPLTKFEVKEAIKKHQMLVSLFPDADPVFLMDNVKNMIHDSNSLNQFVISLMEDKKYPLKSEYLRNIELQEEEQKYVKKFDMKYFLEKIPNPEEHFENRNVSYTNSDEYFYALTFLKNKYRFLHVQEIIKIFDSVNCSLIQAAKILDNKKHETIEIEEKNSENVNCKNVSLLQEIAYVQNKSDILDYIKVQNEQTKRAKKLAQESGFFCTCECCFNDEVTLYDVVSCQTGHIFCFSCVRKSCEVIIGDGKCDFPCLTTCTSQFSLKVLQSVLPQKMFSKMAQRKTLEEVRQAEIDDLAFCPFCDFATILAPRDKIMECLNEECLKKTCRLCKRFSHIPSTCKEVEEKEKAEKAKKEKEQTNNRTYIEEKMTEALVRKCFRCSRTFLKESGCNKMTCLCGTIICYVCKQQINGYTHFKDQGGTGQCPLYSNTATLHIEQVRQGAQRAKQDLGDVELPFDPSEGI